MDDRHLQALEQYFGYTSFRPLQGEIIEDILAGKDVFVLMPTGGGKSLCYQLPALLTKGLVIVVSPLIALMKDQVDSLHELGIPATFINSSLDPQEVSHRKDLIRRGAVKILYCAPERLVMPDFLGFLTTLEVAFIAIDEAHCISEWGHDFRPEYRQLAAVRKKFGDIPVMALTATATERVANDIVEQLGIGKHGSRYKASFNRPNLIYSVQPKGDTFNDLLRFLETHKGESGIIYCMSRASTEGIAERLASRGYRAVAYHAGMTSAQRSKNQEDFIRDKVDIVCATIAFGMGIDKSNVRFVVHYDISKNLEGYYQETGRAGRDGLPSDCVLFYSAGDKIKISRLIQNDKLPQNIVKNNLANLDLICKYAELRTCRKKMVLEYFGEKQPTDNCGACDNCLGSGEKRETADLTVAAQKFLSTIIRTSQRFGAGYIADVLTGNDKEDRIIHNGHHTISTFGIGKEYKKPQWQHIAKELEAEGYIVRDEEYHTLQLTPKGNDALVNRSLVLLAPPPVKTKKTKEEKAAAPSRTVTADLSELSAKLFEALRALRKELADKQNVPPYVIFHDSVLREMTVKLPRTEEQFGKMTGVGEVKKKHYASAFVAVINEFVKPLEKVGDPYIPPAIPSTAGLTKSLFQKGHSLKEIAEIRGLATSTIATHLEGFIAEGEVDDIDRLIDASKIEAIREAFKKVGSMNSLSPVMAILDKEKFGYEDLRFVRAFDYANNVGSEANSAPN